MHTDQPLTCWFPPAILLLLTQPSSYWVRILPLGSLGLTNPGSSSSSYHPSLLDTTFLCFTPMADATFEANRVSCPLHEFSQFCSAFLWVYENWTCSFSATFALCSPLKCRCPLMHIPDPLLFPDDSHSGASFLIAVVPFLISLRLSSIFLSRAFTLL